VAEETPQERDHAMSNRIAVVGESQNDFDVAAILIDQSLIRCVDWISEPDIETHRTYVGRDDAEQFVKWQQVEIDRGKDYRRSIRRSFGEQLPRHEVLFRIQRVIYEFTIRSSDTGQPSPFVVIVKDTDASNDARDAIQEARAKYPDVVIGMQHTELECWLIAAFEPRSADETTRLNEMCRGEKQGVGFDPRARSEALTATKRDQEKLSPKRVLNYLTNNDWPRAIDGLNQTSHQLLKERGKQNGLADFLADLEGRLIRVLFNVLVTDR
jgi:hypothetical protein